MLLAAKILDSYLEVSYREVKVAVLVVTIHLPISFLQSSLLSPYLDLTLLE